ncbi:MAG: FAD-dependent oxidoreductase [Nitrospirae bacterium]|nr:MAG: FAD-dependent oxidoreductase [Nitrospirota bacterium]
MIADESSGYRVRLIGREEVAYRTIALYFERPSGFSFLAGQFIDLTLLDLPEPDPDGPTRSLTLASAPSEAHLMVATRVRETVYKRTLASMPLHTFVQIEGPFGHLTLPESQVRPLIFLAGGIGITPFRSMLVEMATLRLPYRVVLFYVNRRPEDAPFLDELRHLQQQIPGYTFVGVMTQPDRSKSSWTGETGHLDYAMLNRYIEGLVAPLYYLAGPPGMVRGVQTMLLKAGIRPMDIRAEEFAGYNARR